jgi:protocatechuate 3,4-dioxygenase beta subunit
VQSANAQTTGTIEGHVLDVRTSQPISGVRASVALGPNFPQIKRMVTDVTGAFRFDGVPPGEYSVRVEADEFRNSGVLPSVNVAAGETVKDVRILMQAMASISGRVFDENDEPLAGMTIEVLSLQESSNGPRMWTPFRGSQGIAAIRPVQTDDLGKYRVAGLEPGEYLIRLTPTEEQTKTLRYPVTFYPQATDPSDAIKITATSGVENTDTDFHVAPKAVRVQGRFVLNDSQPLPRRLLLIPRNAAFLVEPPINWAVAVQRIGNDGFEVWGVTPGSYFLYALSNSGQRPEWVRVPLEVGSQDLTNVTVAVRPAGSVLIRAAADAGATDVDKLDVSNIGFSLTSTEVLPFYPPWSRLSATGEVKLNASEALYFFRAFDLPYGWFISTIRQGGRDVTASGWAASAGTETTVDVIVSNAGGSITGVIKDRKNRPVSAGRYILLPEPSLRANLPLITTSVASEQGMFKIEAVRPGEYTLIAFPDEDRYTPVFMRDLERVQQFERFGERIQVIAGQTTQVSVTVPPAQVLRDR